VDNRGTSNIPDGVLDYTYDVSHQQTSAYGIIVFMRLRG